MMGRDNIAPYGTTMGCHDMAAYKTEKKLKNEEALYFNIQGHVGIPAGLWVRRFCRLWETCAWMFG